MRMNVICRVPTSLQQMIVTNNANSNYIVPHKKSVLNAIIRQYLITIPYTDIPTIPDNEKIIIEIPIIRHKIYSVESEKVLYCDTMFRCHLTDEGQAAIANYFNQIFKEIFHKFMCGYTANNYNEKKQNAKIMHGITEFCIRFNISITNTLLASLRKDWYRYRQKEKETPFNIIY